MSQEFIDLITKTDPAEHVAVDLVLDTNVVAEIDTAADILRLSDEFPTGEDLFASSKFKYRQRRARHSLVLAWWLAKNRIPAGSIGNEVVDLVTGVLASKNNHLSYAVTTAIVRIVRPLVLRGWQPGSLVNVNHRLKGARVDDEILRVAALDHLTVITWEGFTESGIVSDPDKLRDKCQAAGVPVYTPEEYLAAQSVNVHDECGRFIFALAKAVREARSARILEGKNVVELLVPFYRLVLLDDKSFLTRGRS